MEMGSSRCSMGPQTQLLGSSPALLVIWAIGTVRGIGRAHQQWVLQWPQQHSAHGPGFLCPGQCGPCLLHRGGRRDEHTATAAQVLQQQQQPSHHGPQVAPLSLSLQPWMVDSSCHYKYLGKLTFLPSL